jgi:hypothetical protein
MEELSAALVGLMATSDGLLFSGTFTRIRDPNVRRAIAELVRQIGAEAEGTAHCALDGLL